jgi:class 3 adenylate cyclase
MGELGARLLAEAEKNKALMATFGKELESLETGSEPAPAASRTPADGPGCILEFREVSKEFPVTAGAILRRRVATLHAVTDVELRVRRGETFGLVAESGCGKTTLGRMAVALELPTRGRVLFNGTDLNTVSGAIRELLLEVGIETRAGLHTGECELLGDDVGGMAIHIAARVMSLAAPGEILVSSTVKDLVVGSGIEFDQRGTHDLKGAPGRWALFAIHDGAQQDRGQATSELAPVRPDLNDRPRPNACSPRPRHRARRRPRPTTVTKVATPVSLPA